MEASKVYFTDLRTRMGVNLPEKLKRLIRKAGIGEIDFENKYAAIKLHFGEPGNLAFLRPNYAAAVADVVRELGGKPFLTDCNTLYVGGRKNALDHMESAYKNGFTPYTTGCHVLIADGLKGTDEVLVPVEGCEYVREAKIGRAVMDADVFISLNHFKGHEMTGFGGALKNIGMGCGSRAGKMAMHADGKPYVQTDLCAGCGRCIAVCPKDAIRPGLDSSEKILNCKITEYAKAVLDGRPSYCINIVRDISPNCDCHAENDVPIVPDVGMFASADPVALDLACAEAVNRQPVMPNCAITDLQLEHDCDRFHAAHDNTHWQDMIEHGKKLGLGSDEYEIVNIH